MSNITDKTVNHESLIVNHENSIVDESIKNFINRQINCIDNILKISIDDYKSEEILDVIDTFYQFKIDISGDNNEKLHVVLGESAMCFINDKNFVNTFVEKIKDDENEKTIFNSNVQ